MTAKDKIAFEDAREHQIAMEHARRARTEAETVLSLQEEAAEAWDHFQHHVAGFWGRHISRWISG